MIKIDRHTVIQVLGGLMNNPNLLSEVDKYLIEVGDFPNTLDKLIFSAINNLYNDGDGAKVIRSIDVIQYLQNNDVAKNLLEKENGEVFIQDCETKGEPANFNAYYNRLKKLNLLKDVSKTRDISDFYCEDTLNPDYLEINDRFEKMSISDIINALKMEINGYESKFVLQGQVKEKKASDGVRDLIVTLQKKPEVGLNFQGDIFNTVSRGARKGKLFLRSAASGVGKTRRMVGDACAIAYPIRYDRKMQKWVSTGSAEKVLYIMTEQSIEEIQTMILAYLTGYNEEIFLYGTYGAEEMPRIQKAIEIMEMYQDNLLTAEVPDPCSDTIKNLFRTYNMRDGVEHFFYDYIFSSPAMLNEYRDLKVREDVALRLFTTTLKNLAKELNAFVMSATQLTLTNEEQQKGGFRDEKSIRGSKAINDLSDLSAIMSRPTPEELQQLIGFQQSFSFTPNLVTDVFKNRGGRWNRIRIWSYYDAGCLRTDDLFITTADMKPIEAFKIVDLKSCDFNAFTDLCNQFNSTNNGVEIDISPEISETKPEELLSSAAAAFEDDADNRRRVENMSFNDFLKF